MRHSSSPSSRDSRTHSRTHSPDNSPNNLPDDLLNDPLNDPPPVLKSWRALYTLVIINLTVLIGLFYILTKVYS